MDDPIRLLITGTPPAAEAAEFIESRWGPFALATCATLAETEAALAAAPPDALLLHADDGAEALLAWPALSHAVLDAAVIAVVPQVEPAAALRLMELGVQDVVAAGDAKPASLARTLRLAVQRKRIDRAARKAFATDLATGLPNHAQLLEHLTHLFALREREPAPMAVIALRVEGLAATAELMGAESANVLRRKVAVRLRAALRASDVVAAVGADTFAVLLAWIDAERDGERVMRKLAASLQRPFAIAGRERTLAVSAGLALYPGHGKQPESLLRRALGQAASSPAVLRPEVTAPSSLRRTAAANDDEALP